MSYLPTSKWGDCTQCSNTNVACVKIKKDLVCTQCNDRNKALEQIKKQRDRNALRSDLAQVRKLAVDVDGVNMDMAKAYKSKSELLKEADRLFSLFIRNRDCDKNGNVACVCCGKIYNIIENNSQGERVIQNLHFVKREVYSLRFDEDNCNAGCCYCNQDMNLNPKGKAYNQYRQKLVADLGEDIVAEMELAHRNINRIEESQLKTVIEHYGQ